MHNFRHVRSGFIQAEGAIKKLVQASNTELNRQNLDTHRTTVSNPAKSTFSCHG